MSHDICPKDLQMMGNDGQFGAGGAGGAGG